MSFPTSRSRLANSSRASPHSPLRDVGNTLKPGWASDQQAAKVSTKASEQPKDIQEALATSPSMSPASPEQLAEVGSPTAPFSVAKSLVQYSITPSSTVTSYAPEDLDAEVEDVQTAPDGSRWMLMRGSEAPDTPAMDSPKSIDELLEAEVVFEEAQGTGAALKPKSGLAQIKSMVTASPSSTGQSCAQKHVPGHGEATHSSSKTLQGWAQPAEGTDAVSPSPDRSKCSAKQVVSHALCDELGALSLQTSNKWRRGTKVPLRGVPLAQGGHMRFNDADEPEDSPTSGCTVLRGVPMPESTHIRFD